MRGLKFDLSSFLCPLFLPIVLSAAQIASAQSTVQADAAPQRSDTTGTTLTKPVDDNLPWLPGMSQPIDQRNLTRNPPSKALPIPNARPVPPATANEMHSVLVRDQTGNQVTGAPIPVALQTRSETNGATQTQPIANYPVVPAALVTPQEQTQPPANPQQTKPQLVDSAITTVTSGMQQLPNDAGQVWRTYDITPYTYSVQSTTRPEQAIIDWILKETGTEVWFTQPMGVLSADQDTLSVYHTPAMHSRIKPVVDRFIGSRGKTQVVGLRLVTIASPNWRTSAFSMMQRVPVNSSGVEAWLMSKENAAILAGQLRNRSDYQEHNNGDLVISDGQKYTLSNKRPVDFLRSIQLVNNNGFAQYQPVNDRINEGYSVDFSALSSTDGRTIEAIVGCDINQIEKMQRVTIDLPSASGQTQPVDLQIPQMVSWNVNERFRWPSDQVLVLSCGVVATPGPQREALFGIPSLFNGTRGRADALMFVEYKGLAPRNNPVQNNSTAGQGSLVPVSPRR